MTQDPEKRLTQIFQQLPAAQSETLLEFAEFLLSRYGEVAPDSETASVGKVSAPVDIPRPSEESVVRAVKRLRATYPMLDPRKLLNQTSELMTQHMVHGREAVEVIEELEILFKSHYEQLTEAGKK